MTRSWRAESGLDLARSSLCGLNLKEPYFTSRECVCIFFMYEE
jgi:hypothetical protein